MISRLYPEVSPAMFGKRVPAAARIRGLWVRYFASLCRRWAGVRSSGLLEVATRSPPLSAGAWHPPSRLFMRSDDVRLGRHGSYQTAAANRRPRARRSDAKSGPGHTKSSWTGRTAGWGSMHCPLAPLECGGGELLHSKGLRSSGAQKHTVRYRDPRTRRR